MLPACLGFRRTTASFGVCPYALGMPFPRKFGTSLSTPQAGESARTRPPLPFAFNGRTHPACGTCTFLDRAEWTSTSATRIGVPRCRIKMPLRVKSMSTSISGTSRAQCATSPSTWRFTVPSRCWRSAWTRMRPSSSPHRFRLALQWSFTELRSPRGAAPVDPG